MWDFIECLLKVSVYNINLNSFVQVIYALYTAVRAYWDDHPAP